MNRNLKIFILTSAFALVFLSVSFFSYKYLKDIKKREEAYKIKEIQVFFPYEEIAAICLLNKKRMYIGKKDGVFLIDSEKGEILKCISSELHLIYSGDIKVWKKDFLWVAHDEGLSIFFKNRWKHFKSPEVPAGRCNSIKIVNDTVYAAFQQGAAVFKINENLLENHIEKLSSYNGLAEKTVSTIEKDFFGNIWYGSYYCAQKGGISIYGDGKWRYLSVNEGLPHRYVTALASFEYLKKDYMLIGTGYLTKGGLALALCSDKVEKIEVLKAFNSENGIPGEKVKYLYLDFPRIWITTEMDGILITDVRNIIKSEKLKGIYLTKKNGLSSDEIKFITKDDKKYYLAGKEGLTIIPKEVIDKMWRDFNFSK